MSGWAQAEATCLRLPSPHDYVGHVVSDILVLGVAQVVVVDGILDGGSYPAQTRYSVVVLSGMLLAAHRTS